MKPEALIDAGPLIALLHKNDDAHEPCVEVFERLRAPLLTTWAPITEAMYLLDFSRAAQDALLRMVERGAVRVETTEERDLPYIRKLMDKYADRPMDFADATLVQLADKTGIRKVFTLDRRDFSVYRTRRGRAFDILP